MLEMTQVNNPGDKTNKCWSAEWQVTYAFNRCGNRTAGRDCSCRYCGHEMKSATFFEILIDFDDADAGIISTGQKSVLLHMEKLLSNRNLADVTFRFPGNMTPIIYLSLSLIEQCKHVFFLYPVKQITVRSRLTLSF